MGLGDTNDPAYFRVIGRRRLILHNIGKRLSMRRLRGLCEWGIRGWPTCQDFKTGARMSRRGLRSDFCVLSCELVRLRAAFVAVQIS